MAPTPNDLPTYLCSAVFQQALIPLSISHHQEWGPSLTKLSLKQGPVLWRWRLDSRNQTTSTETTPTDPRHDVDFFVNI